MMRSTLFCIYLLLHNRVGGGKKKNEAHLKKKKVMRFFISLPFSLSPYYLLARSRRLLPFLVFVFRMDLGPPLRREPRRRRVVVVVVVVKRVGIRRGRR